MGIKERKEREKLIRRKQIKIAAKEEFTRKGFHLTSMEDIANRVELSPATIYLYFKSKEELFASMTLDTIKYMLKQVEKICNNNKLSIEEKILGLKVALYKAYKFDPLIIPNILHFQIRNTLSDLSNEMLKEINDNTRKIMEMIGEIYNDGVCQGKFIEAKAITIVDIIWGTFSGLFVWLEAKRRVDPSKDYFKLTLNKAFDIFLKGIEKQKS